MLSRLPLELVLAVALHLGNVADVGALGCTCRALRDALSSLDAVWANLCQHYVSPAAAARAHRLERSWRPLLRRAHLYRGPRFEPAEGVSRSRLSVWIDGPRQYVCDATECGSCTFVIEQHAGALVGVGVEGTLGRPTTMLGDGSSGALYSNGGLGFHGAVDFEDAAHAYCSQPVNAVRVRYSASAHTLSFEVNGQAMFTPYFGIPPRPYRFAVCALAGARCRITIDPWAE